METINEGADGYILDPFDVKLLEMIKASEKGDC